jgi:hypothetical protein
LTLLVLIGRALADYRTGEKAAGISSFFTVNILEALDNKISIPLIARLFGFSFYV